MVIDIGFDVWKNFPTELSHTVLLNQARCLRSGRQGCSQFLVSPVSVCVYVCLSGFWYPLIKWPIMGGFQSLGCLWKCLDKTFQYIMLKFLKSHHLSKQDPVKFLKITFTNFRRNFALSFCYPLIKQKKIIYIVSVGCIY